MNTFKIKRTGKAFHVISLFLLVVSCNTKKNSITTPNNYRELSAVKRLPIEVIPMRDGETTRIKIQNSTDIKFSKLCFVRSSDAKVGGKIYINENWRDTNEEPLSINDSKMALNHVEKTLIKFYGDAEIKRIISNRMAINNLTDEEMGKYMTDPKLNDELDATFASDLIFEFRDYLETQEKNN